jgi:hypothetical protein
MLFRLVGLIERGLERGLEATWPSEACAERFFREPGRVSVGPPLKSQKPLRSGFPEVGDGRSSLCDARARLVVTWLILPVVICLSNTSEMASKSGAEKAFPLVSLRKRRGNTVELPGHPATSLVPSLALKRAGTPGGNSRVW